MTDWQPIETAPKDGTWIIVPNEPVAMKWLYIEPCDGEGDMSLWVWADDGVSDVDPEPGQPKFFIPFPRFPGAE